MGRGLVLCYPTRAIARVSLLLPKCKISFVSLNRLHHLCHAPRCVPSTRTFCKCAALQEQTIDITEYKDAFSRRMAMAGLRPHNRIALGVSGGPDSMALCVLAANWKTEGLNAVRKKDEYIDGLLAIIVDHGLRAESRDEAILVRNRVSEMGVRCEIACCEWPDGKPKQGHLQEAARDMRYQMFQDLCVQNQIRVLLIAHHADDQAELFILRSSRGSGVLGLAGMAFTSQLFSSHVHCYKGDLKNQSILLVRPLLDFSKEDLYKVCHRFHKEWVEDPTNRSPLFARNRIRMSLGNLSSCILKSELLAVISACRETRAYVDKICHNLINQAVTIVNQGYAVIDLKILNASKIEDIFLSRFLAWVLLFISQRQRPIRGSTSKLLLNYIRTTPCKNSLTAAGCYLSPAPGSKGTKALICCSVECPMPSKSEVFYMHSNEVYKDCDPNELEHIIANGESYSNNLVPDASEVHFLHLGSASVLDEARRLDILSETSYRNILLLQSEEVRHFRSKTDVNFDYEAREVENVSKSPSELLQPGQTCYFMNRFIVTWKLRKEISNKAFSGETSCNTNFGGESHLSCCSYCTIGDDSVAEVRHMIEADWLYLAELSKCPGTENKNVPASVKANQMMDKKTPCRDYSRLSAQKALRSLKSIPLAARRSLPVLVNPHGVLLSVPSIGFTHYPCLMVSVVFKPRVSLGGGHSSFI
ncbi:hypothetical protein SLEP1_g18480 [Rubroshorea leprosula]|uniref:tRNA(Ile)-lysidine synthetase n=1 Tax=Rubroshorea leprosula TaxID=152421 RepID=A0AAV5IXK9_9ROSI|nr:hypothetical protein SLEP1_g18480 [Rubroshorea leprosula]